MPFTLAALSVALALFLGMMLFFEVGRRLGRHAIAKRGDAAQVGIGGGIDNSVYALLALLIGFTFSGAITRFDHHRDLIIREVNTIGTAWRRVAALPAERQPEIRASFRRYVDALIVVHNAPPLSAEEARDLAAMVQAENDLWQRSMTASLEIDGEKARMLLPPALNEMFHTVGEERLARRIDPPKIIFVMLFLAAFTAAMFGGYTMAKAAERNWLVILGASATISLTVLLIIELEAPRRGLVRVNPFDRALVEIRATMN